MKTYYGISLSSGLVHGTIVFAQEVVSKKIINSTHTDISMQFIAFDCIPSIDLFINIITRTGVVGAIVQQCSPYSHLNWAINYFNMPTIVFNIRLLPHGYRTVYIDFDTGAIMLPESHSEEEELQRIEIFRKTKYEALKSKTLLPAVSKSGVDVKVLAQIQSAYDVVIAKQNGADGVGEIKSNIKLDLFGNFKLNVAHIVSAIQLNTQWETIPLRFFDFTIDNPAPTGIRIGNQGPLGYRGIRALEICDSLMDLFLEELEGVDSGNIVIVLPMVTVPSEVERFRKRLGNSTARVGVQIETPAAALTVNDFLEVTDYIVIGVNDLTQFTMAWDRNTPNAERLPANKLIKPVAKLVEMVTRAALDKQAFASVAIDLNPSEPLVKQLIEMEVQAITISPRLIPTWKDKIRSTE